MTALSRAAALSAALTLTFTAPALAQIFSQTLQLATMRQQIPESTITVAGIGQLQPALQRAMLREMTPRHAAALRAALDHAIVATEFRPNGVSEDQVTLAEYLQSLGIDPGLVVAVRIAPYIDRENPPITVFYRAPVPR
jgi:hypothetical protein